MHRVFQMMQSFVCFIGPIPPDISIILGVTQWSYEALANFPAENIHAMVSRIIEGRTKYGVDHLEMSFEEGMVTQ